MSNSQLALLAYIFVLVPGMLIGFYFARTKRFSPHHKFVMTGVTVLNWVLILWLMLASYANYVAPYLSNIGDTLILLPTLHMITGGVAQLLATYLVILMWTEKTPLEKIVPYRIKNIKTPMRLTLGLWLVTVLLGIAIYATWNAAASASSDTPAPAATEEASVEATETATDGTQPSATEEANDDDDDAKPAATESTGG